MSWASANTNNEWPGTPGKPRWEQAWSLLKLLIWNGKRSNCVLHSKRESPFWQEAWRIPRGKIFWRFKDTPGCLAILHFFTLIFITVRWGVVSGICVFFQLKAKIQHKWRPGKVWQVHRSIQVTIERMSSHKYPRCQNSNKTISSLISCLLMTHKLSIHLWNPWNMASEDVTFYKWKGRVFVPVLFVGYLGIVFAKSLIRLSSGIVKFQV